MKKVASVVAVIVFTIGMVSCTDNSASNDEFYDNMEVMANDDNERPSSGGSGGM